jgi:hypothetical protein
VTKYKPSRTPHQLAQNVEDGNARAGDLKKKASSTIAHTRELLRQSRELIDRSKDRAKALEKAAIRFERLDHKK